MYGNSIVIEDYANGVNRKRMAVGISIYNVSQFFITNQNLWIKNPYGYQNLNFNHETIV